MKKSIEINLSEMRKIITKGEDLDEAKSYITNFLRERVLSEIIDASNKEGVKRFLPILNDLRNDIKEIFSKYEKMIDEKIRRLSIKIK